VYCDRISSTFRNEVLFLSLVALAAFFMTVACFAYAWLWRWRLEIVAELVVLDQTAVHPRTCENLKCKRPEFFGVALAIAAAWIRVPLTESDEHLAGTSADKPKGTRPIFRVKQWQRLCRKPIEPGEGKLVVVLNETTRLECRRRVLCLWWAPSFSGHCAPGSCCLCGWARFKNQSEGCRHGTVCPASPVFQPTV
jgi:hypothetical protein